ncbi:MAG: hypothetical protein ACU0DW_00780 [Shimia sp.]
MQHALLALSALIVGLILSLPAYAQQACAPRALLLDRLEDRYGESRRTIGIAANRQVIETFANDETGSWSIVVTAPSGQSCLVASGTAFEAMAAAQIAEGDPA